MRFPFTALREKDYSEANSQDVSVNCARYYVRLLDFRRLHISVALQDNEIYAPLTKKELRDDARKALGHTSEAYKNVDLDYVYIEFEQEFHKWQEGEHVVTKVSKSNGKGMILRFERKHESNQLELYLSSPFSGGRASRITAGHVERHTSGPRGSDVQGCRE